MTELKTKSEIKEALTKSIVYAEVENRKVIIRDCRTNGASNFASVLQVRVAEGWRTPERVFVEGNN